MVPTYVVGPIKMIRNVFTIFYDQMFFLLFLQVFYKLISYYLEKCGLGLGTFSWLGKIQLEKLSKTLFGI